MRSLLGASMCPKRWINLRVPKPSSVAMATRGEPEQCGCQILQQPWARAGGSDSSCACAGPGRVPGSPSPLALTRRVADVGDTPPEAVPGSGSGGWLRGVRAARGVDPCGSGGREQSRLLGE